MRVSQRAPDTALMRRVYTGDSATTITLMEPLVTGLWKGSVRDESMYNGKKSAFVAYDTDFHMRFVIKDLDSLFETFHSSGTTDALGNVFYPIFKPTIQSATLHVQFAKPLFDIPRTVKYTWPRFRCYTVEHSGSEKISFPVIRVGDVPHALMVSHRVKKSGLWFDQKQIPAIVNDSGCFVKELSIRHNFSVDNFNLDGGNRSKALQFYTKKSFPHLPTNSLGYTHNQTLGLSRADLNITESALRTMQDEGCIEMGIKMTVDSGNTTRLTYNKHTPAVAPAAVATNLESNLFILPTFTMVAGDGAVVPDVQVPVLDFSSGAGTTQPVLDANGDPEVDVFTGEPTGAIIVEALVSTFAFELFVDPTTN
jgi:hypothetical protein